jgi:fatty-acyl-CoA synthase
LEQIRTGQCNLIEWLEGLVEAHGHAIAQTYVASGEPDDEPRELTFAEFVARVRRCSKALATLGVGPQDVVAFAGPLSETSFPMLIAVITTATFLRSTISLRPKALSRIVNASGATTLLLHCRREDGPEIIGKLRRVRDALPHLRLVNFGGRKPRRFLQPMAEAAR